MFSFILKKIKFEYVYHLSAYIKVIILFFSPLEMFKFSISFLYLIIIKCSSITLDYSLYSQLNVDLEPIENSTIVNYYKLNVETLKKYDEYLYFSNEERIRLKKLTKSMFEFGYDNYMKFAFPKGNYFIQNQI